MMELNIIALSIALAGSIIASYTDIKTKEIPNLLTLSMIFLGLLFFTFSFYGNWIFFIPLLASYIIIWLIWRAG
ncbi:MAG: prepilin peptidase, partial [Thermoplasmata archaeon]|nr:prepilin peptidase [Thermoplasmata archaeon]